MVVAFWGQERGIQESKVEEKPHLTAFDPLTFFPACPLPLSPAAFCTVSAYSAGCTKKSLLFRVTMWG